MTGDVKPLEAPSVDASYGLSSAEAAARLRREGPNVFPTWRPTPPWKLLGRQMVHLLALMLWVAGGLAVLAGMSELGVAIFLVILLNGIFAFLQEHRAERTAEKLRDLLPRRARVTRDGALVEIDAAYLVPGDVVLLERGDRISSDLRLLGRSLKTRPSMTAVLLILFAYGQKRSAAAGRGSLCAATFSGVARCDDH